MSSWDRRPLAAQSKAAATALRTQVVDVVGPFSPFWRERLKTLGRTAASVATLEAVAQLPAVGERDVCPDGDPAGAAALVVQAGERGWALHAEGPVLRRGLARRLVAPRSYAAVVEADTRPTSFVWAGLAMRFPVASTRRDLDVVARCGARLWSVLGLTRADVVVSALPLLPRAEAQALSLGALGAGSPLLAPGNAPDAVAEALGLVPATVLALPADDAAELLDDLDQAGAPLDGVRTVLLVGAPDDDERAAARAALERAGVRDAVVLAVHVPDGHRLPWGECRESGGGSGLHTYPDLELLDAVDPATGERADGAGPRELVLSQLGMRGTALLRWRTGDVVDAVTPEPCPACGRTVPRVVGTRRAALVPPLSLRDGVTPVDLRAAAGGLVGRPDLDDWRLVVRRSPRDGRDQLLVHVRPAASATASDVVTAVDAAVRSSAGLAPTQVVLDDDLPADGHPLGSHLLLR
ncbi:MAG TPA: hypothetical protein VNU26_08975 [Mycobacteriales bacterium]|nr:hypothetical protein [Mycobacteriales bacterium]